MQLCVGIFPLTACVPISYDAVTRNQLAHRDMRVVHSADVDIYYASGDEEPVSRIAGRLLQCVRWLREKRVVGAPPRDPLTVVMHDGEMNNAYVTMGVVGSPEHMVLPLHESLDLFNFFNQGIVDVGDVACHEAVHAVIGQEATGFWSGVHTVFGEVLSPGATVPRWFHEGMATYYESSMGRNVGRMRSPLWRGRFASLAADRGHMNVGRLDGLDRETSGMGSGPYVVGSHFIEFLAERYGDTKLWEVVDEHARAVFTPFGFTLRFKAVYGKDIAELFAEFVDNLDQSFPLRERPAQQRVLHKNVGIDARMAVSQANGDITVVHLDVDKVTRLTTYAPEGSMRWSRRLADILPNREHVVSRPVFASGLGFSRDASRLFVTLSDESRDAGYEAWIFEIDPQTGRDIKKWGPVRGVGGGVSADGSAYAYVRNDRDHACLALYNLIDGTTQDLASGGLDETGSLSSPTFSPDGRKLAFSYRSERGFDLYVRFEDGSLQNFTSDGAFNLLPRWQDDSHIVFVRNNDGRTQAHRIDLFDRIVEPLTDAPYAVLDAAPWQDGRVVFLSADGVGWNIEFVDALAPGAATVEVIAQSREAQDGQGGAWPDPEPFDVTASVPYKSTHHLGRPTLAAPWFTFSWDRAGFHLGHVALYLLGLDALGYHNYKLVGGYNFSDDFPFVDAVYVNTHLSPWLILAQAHFDTQLVHATDQERFLLPDRMVFVGAARSFWSTFFSFGLLARDLGADAGTWGTPHVGPGISVSYAAGEETLYGGDSLVLQAAATVSATTDGSTTYTDTQLQVVMKTPLPLSRRHSLRLNLEAQRLWGTPRPSIVMAAQRSESRIEGASPHAPFSGYRHTLRGYEDASWATDNLAVLEAVYTYPFIIDRGWASLLYIVNQPFLRQIDLEVFGVASAHGQVADGREWHRAVGAALIVRGAFNLVIPVPLSLGYQVSRRFDSGSPWEHRVVVGLM